MDENNNEPTESKRLKLGDLNDVNSIIDAKMKSQNQDVFKLRISLENKLNDDDYIAILNENDQFIPSDRTKVRQFSLSSCNHILILCLFALCGFVKRFLTM